MAWADCSRKTRCGRSWRRRRAAAAADRRTGSGEPASSCGNRWVEKGLRTSSKPPSSDIVKPPKPKLPGGKGRKRRRGGQPGHPRHVRPLFPPEQVDRTWDYEWPEAGAQWQPLDEFRTLQQVELVEKLFEVTEHRARLYRSRITGEVVAAPLPEDVRLAGLVGRG